MRALECPSSNLSFTTHDLGNESFSCFTVSPAIGVVRVLDLGHSNRRALEDDHDILKMVREARVISPGVLANSTPQEASKNSGLQEGLISQRGICHLYLVPAPALHSSYLPGLPA
ncbi:uncharacterized protein LOC144321121 isoform X2 [Canis aureus]